MLNDNSTPKHFSAEAVNIDYYLHNLIYIRLILIKTPYELWKGQNLTYHTSILLDVNVSF